MYQHWTSDHPFLRFAIPAVEAILAIWLLTGFQIRVSAMLVIVTVSAFSGLLIAELSKEHPRPCGCMGALAQAYEPKAIRNDLLVGLGRNGLLMAGAGYFFVVARKKRAGNIRDELPTTVATH